MKKINTKGFALVETLIVSAFVVSIFTIMYTNFYPIMGEYEKRENYDDIGLLYSSNLFKGLIEKNKRTVKDYEVWGFIKVLDIEFEDLYSNIKEKLDY